MSRISPAASEFTYRISQNVTNVWRQKILINYCLGKALL